MNLGELIKKLEDLQELHGSDIDVCYVGLYSPVSDAEHWVQPGTGIQYILLEGC